MKLITIITTRGSASNNERLRKTTFSRRSYSLGKGTAPSEILDKLLLGDTNKD